jgi:hypothetical protein
MRRAARCTCARLKFNGSHVSRCTGRRRMHQDTKTQRHEAKVLLFVFRVFFVSSRLRVFVPLAGGAGQRDGGCRSIEYSLHEPHPRVSHLEHTAHTAIHEFHIPLVAVPGLPLIPPGP